MARARASAYIPRWRRLRRRQLPAMHPEAPEPGVIAMQHTTADNPIATRNARRCEEERSTA